VRSILVVLLFTLPAFAQNPSGPSMGSPGCGPPDARFEVKTEKKPSVVSKPIQGKAMVYFFQDDSRFTTAPPRPTTLVGLDGQWVTATHANSYTYFTVEPGEHHLCTRWQGYSYLASVHTSAALHFTAQPDGVYYFLVKNSSSPQRIAEAKLERMNSDEGELLANSFSFSTSHPKK
jgi:hypothetical protein